MMKLAIVTTPSKGTTEDKNGTRGKISVTGRLAIVNTIPRYGYLSTSRINIMAIAPRSNDEVIYGTVRRAISR
jgi:hypothetical protein